MLPPPFSTYDMSEDDAEMMFEIYNNLKKIYPTETDMGFSLDIKKFEVFSGDELNDYGPVFRITINGRFFYLNFIEILYGARSSKSSHLGYQTWGSIELKDNYGHILIKQESFIDKIQDLINPIDIDFEDDKAFSKRFLVVSNDKLKAHLQMTANFRRCIMEIDLKEFVIEIIDNTLLIGNEKPVTPESTIQFAKFMEKIVRAF